LNIDIGDDQVVGREEEFVSHLTRFVIYTKDSGFDDIG